MKKKTLYMFKVEYLREHGFEGHIKNVRYHYRRVFNSFRGKSAAARLAEYRTSNPRGQGLRSNTLDPVVGMSDFENKKGETR